MTARIDRPGTYDLSAKTYHSDPAPDPSLSSTMARTILNRSPLHCWHLSPRLNTMAEPRPPTDAMEHGAIVHRLVLGVGAEIVEVDAPNWKCRREQELRAEAREAGKLPVLSWRLAEL